MKKIILRLMTVAVILTMGIVPTGCAGISGSIVQAADVKNVLDISDVKQISGNPSTSSSAPVLAFTIKNISDKAVGIGNSFQTFSITVFSVSKKDDKMILGQPTQLSLVLQPREVRLMQIPLFPSDETTYKMVVVYLKPPSNVQGKYVQAQSEIVRQIENKLDISCELITKPGDAKRAWFVGKVKNISGTTFTLSKKGDINDALSLNINLFDESGNGWGAWPDIHLRDTGNGLSMAPGESISYEIDIDSAIASKIVKYEIRLYYGSPIFGKNSKLIN